MSATTETGSGWLSDLRIGVKIALALAIVAIVAAGVATVSLVRVSDTNDNLTRLSETNVTRLRAFSEIRGGQAVMNAGASQALGMQLAAMNHTSASNDPKALLATGLAGVAMVDSGLKTYSSLSAGTPAELQATAQDLQKVWPVFKNAYQVFVLQQKPMPGVKLLENPNDMLALQAAMDADVSKLASLEDTDAAAVVDAGRRSYHRTVIGILVSLGIGLLLAGLAAFVIVRGMVRRIKATADTLHQVAEGDLTTRAAVAGRDEIGQMAEALNSTLGTVHDIIQQIEVSADQLAQFAREDSPSSAEGPALGSVEELAEMATTLSAMTSIFQTERATV